MARVHASRRSEVDRHAAIVVSRRLAGWHRVVPPRRASKRRSRVTSPGIRSTSITDSQSLSEADALLRFVVGEVLALSFRSPLPRGLRPRLRTPASRRNSCVSFLSETRPDRCPRRPVARTYSQAASETSWARLAERRELELPLGRGDSEVSSVPHRAICMRRCTRCRPSQPRQRAIDTARFVALRSAMRLEELFAQNSSTRMCS
jgi:hypothetical protein